MVYKPTPFFYHVERFDTHSVCFHESGLNPSNVKEIPGGRSGKLPDGRRINVRDHNSDGRPTLEVQNGKNRIKVRYGEGD